MVRPPPHCSAAWARSGRPRPVRFPFVVKNGSRARRASFCDMPRPLSDTRIVRRFRFSFSLIRDGDPRRPGRDRVLGDVEDVERQVLHHDPQTLLPFFDRRAIRISSKRRGREEEIRRCPADVLGPMGVGKTDQRDRGAQPRRPPGLRRGSSGGRPRGRRVSRSGGMKPSWEMMLNASLSMWDAIARPP